MSIGDKDDVDDSKVEGAEGEPEPCEEKGEAGSEVD